MSASDVAFVAKSFLDHLPVYQVLVPFAFAPLCVLFGNRKVAWGLTFIAGLLSFVISLLLLQQVIDVGVIS